MSDRLLAILQQVVQQEVARQRTSMLGVVSTIFPHEGVDDENNYEINVRLKHEDLELHRVPLAVPHVGVAAPPRVGDLVLVHLSGWAPMDGADPGSSLIVHTALPVVGAVAYPALRVDIARVSRSPKLALSGFELRLSLLASSVSERPLHELIEEPMCIVSESPGRPRFQLRIGGEPSCQHD